MEVTKTCDTEFLGLDRQLERQPWGIAQIRGGGRPLLESQQVPAHPALCVDRDSWHQRRSLDHKCPMIIDTTSSDVIVAKWCEECSSLSQSAAGSPFVQHWPATGRFRVSPRDMHSKRRYVAAGHFPIIGIPRAMSDSNAHILSRIGPDRCATASTLLGRLCGVNTPHATVAMLAVYGDERRIHCGSDGLVFHRDDGGLRAERWRASQSGHDRGASGRVAAPAGKRTGAGCPSVPKLAMVRKAFR